MKTICKKCQSLPSGQNSLYIIREAMSDNLMIEDGTALTPLEALSLRGGGVFNLYVDVAEVPEMFCIFEGIDDAVVVNRDCRFGLDEVEPWIGSGDHRPHVSLFAPLEVSISDFKGNHRETVVPFAGVL